MEIEKLGRIVSEDKEFIDKMEQYIKEENYMYHCYQYDDEAEIILEVYRVVPEESEQ